MDKLKKITIASLLFTVSSLSTVFAGTVTTEQLQDDYIGAHYKDDVSGGSNYDTNWMKITRSYNETSGDSFLNVWINSNFVGYDSYYNYGDLFLMTADGESGDYNKADKCADKAGKYGCNEDSYSAGTNKWQYAFDLGDTRQNTLEDQNNNHGDLRKINTSGDIGYSSSDYQKHITTSSENSGYYGRKWQAIKVSNNANDIGDGTWSTSGANNLLDMSFNITGTSLATAHQLALRWAMTCANDIIEVVANLESSEKSHSGKPTTSVPEPSTILLMIVAFAGLVNQRKKFKA